MGGLLSIENLSPRTIAVVSGLTILITPLIAFKLQTTGFPIVEWPEGWKLWTPADTTPTPNIETPPFAPPEMLDMNIVYASGVPKLSDGEKEFLEQKLYEHGLIDGDPKTPTVVVVAPTGSSVVEIMNAIDAIRGGANQDAVFDGMSQDAKNNWNAVVGHYNAGRDVVLSDRTGANSYKIPRISPTRH